jgi:cellulose synthase/poly-beta-1,6-N-acetylglucosamine synthase-like glycosyltransferase
MMQLFSATLGAILIFLFGVGVASFVALVRGCFELRRLARGSSDDFAFVLLKSPLVPGISVIVTPPDAGAESRAHVRRLLDLHFGSSEVVAVLDGPSEAEFARWSDEFRLVGVERNATGDLPAGRVRGIYGSSDPIRLVVVDKEQGGEAGAFNAGVNVAEWPVLGLVDPESEFVPELLLYLIRPMVQDWERTLAVCGTAPPPAAPGMAGRIGALELVRLWMVRCAAFHAWNMLAPVPGAAVLIKREAVIAAGGFGRGPAQWFRQLHSAGKRVALVSAAVSCVRAPRTWAKVRRLTQRDQRQLSGAMGPALLVVRVARPLLETAAYAMAAAGLAMGWIGVASALLVLLATAGVGIVVSMTAVVLSELAEPSAAGPSQLAGLFFTAFPENLGYRQIRNLWLIGDFFGAMGSAKRNRARTPPGAA